MWTREMSLLGTTNRGEVRTPEGLEHSTRQALNTMTSRSRVPRRLLSKMLCGVVSQHPGQGQCQVSE